MKSVQIKKLILAAVISSGVGLSVPAFSEIPSNRAVDIDSTENIAAPPDRNITNPNVDGYTPREVAPVVESADVDHEGVVHFEPNSVTLSQQGEGQLKQLVEQLDKDKPIALTVSMHTQSESQSVRGSKDSSAGYPGEGEGLAGRDISPPDTRTSNTPGATPNESHAINNNSQAVESEQENRAELIARYRVESIRLYLQEKGIEVVEWNMEGQPSSFSDIQPSESAGLAGRQEADLENVQQVRVVVIGEIQPEGLSSL